MALNSCLSVQSPDSLATWFSPTTCPIRQYISLTLTLTTLSHFLEAPYTDLQLYNVFSSRENYCRRLITRMTALMYRRRNLNLFFIVAMFRRTIKPCFTSTVRYVVWSPVSIQTQSLAWISRNKRKRQPIRMLGRSSGNHDWLLANASACVSCGFRLHNARYARNARNASDCVWMETGLKFSGSVLTAVLPFNLLSLPVKQLAVKFVLI